MNTLHLQYIITVAEYGSINKASQQLNMKNQYLSYLIKNMEDELHIQIFQRHSRGVTVTEDGQVFLEYAKLIVDTANKMHLQHQYPSKQVYTDEEITLNLYIPPLLYPVNLNKSLATYRKFFPHVKINYTTGYLEDCLAAIQQEPYAITLQPDAIQFERLATKLPPQLKIIKLYSSTLVALTNRQNAVQQNLTSITVQELLEKELILYSSGKIEQSALYQGLAKHGIPNIVSTIENQTIFIDTLENGNYFTVGSLRLAQNNKNIVAIPISDFDSNFLSVVAIVREDIATSPIIRDFLNILLLQIDKPTL